MSLFQSTEQLAAEAQTRPTTSITMRPYQVECDEAVREAHAERQSTLFVMATGLGKTVNAAFQIRDALERGRVMVCAHRDVLLDQATNKVKEVTGVTPEREQAEEWAHPDSRVVVATWDTMRSQIKGSGKMRRDRFNPDDYSLLWIDEAHRSCARTYKATIDYFAQNKGCRILGCTATPSRTDERALGMVYGSCAYEYWIHDAVPDGWLVEPMALPVRVHDIDLSDVPVSCGDLSAAQLDALLSEEGAIHQMAHPTFHESQGRQTLVFAPGVQFATLFADILNRWESGCADVVTGKTSDEDRRAIYKRFHRGEIRFLVNVGVLTEGYDEDRIGCIAMCRPTQSDGLFTQMLGRGTRALYELIRPLNRASSAEERRAIIAGSAKPNLLVLDFVFASRRGLVSTADVLGGKYDDTVVQKAKDNIGDRDGPVDIGIELEKAKHEVEEEQKRKLKVKSIYEVGNLGPFKLFGMEPAKVRGWDEPPSDKQKGALAKLGLKPKEMPTTKRQASQILGKLFGRIDNQWCSFRQAKVLARAGLDPKGVRFSEASRIIDGLKQNNWTPTAEMWEQWGTKDETS